MSPCTKHQRELAARAALASPATSDLAVHLQSCPACQRVFAEYQAVAALQRKAVSELPVAKSPSDLGTWFLDHQNRRVRNSARPVLPSVKFAFGGVAFCALFVALAFVLRDPRPAPAPKQAAHVSQPTETREAPSLAGPTWQAFRSEIGSDHFSLKFTGQARGFGWSAGQYRIKDAYSITD